LLISFVITSQLFLSGNKKPAGSKAGDQAPALAITKEELRDIRQKTEKGQKSDAIVIS
jgi:Trichohyalin-plectin-homology domain